VLSCGRLRTVRAIVRPNFATCNRDVRRGVRARCVGVTIDDSQRIRLDRAIFVGFESRPPRYCRQVARRLAAYVRELASPDTASALASDSLRSSGSADFVQELSESCPPR